ncbi:MAG TPA: GGDEF domain-containing protein [Solirubrobacteraceae bacterium]|nr:GGDEF domain-containing protein [Solirubrobacteraceae bacterium]
MTATADQLTGLPSAQAFVVALERQAALARRYDRPGAVILLAAARGDDAGCRAVARVLEERLRSTDLLARTAGCEFAILVPEARATEARELAGELVAQAARAAGSPAAAGIACFPDGLARPAGALLADADTALAAAQGAVPPVAVFDARVFRTSRIAGSPAERLRRALSGGDLMLDRVPVIDLRSGATDHRAVTVRLRDAPDGLLERAERFGLGRQIDRLAVEHALAAAAEDPAPLVVPLAAGAASDRDFADWLVEALSARPGADLVLAVPESAALVDLAAVRSLAARVGEFGGRIALDQFGRLGAFALLKALPVHQVRLDPELVRGLPGSDRDHAVVLALVRAAEALGAEPVATGVDGEAELTAVRGFGINLAQGAMSATSGQR